MFITPSEGTGPLWLNTGLFTMRFVLCRMGIAYMLIRIPITRDYNTILSFRLVEDIDHFALEHDLLSSQGSS